MSGSVVPASLEALLAERPMSAMRWGLERVEALLDELGHPERAFTTYHIAGTNGKGSTARFAASLLEAGGSRTGLYASPHLSDVRERFTIDGRWIADECLESAAHRVIDCPAAGECTYFEATTALAFLAFAESGVDVAVIETGLGGRLDATNVLRPAGIAITPIGLDHVDLLGTTVEEIAEEKAGILKPDVPVALGRLSPAAHDVLTVRAAEMAAPMATLGIDATIAGLTTTAGGTEFSYRSAVRSEAVALSTSMVGAHQADNAALAIMMLDGSGRALAAADVQTGVAETRVPGRFELRSRKGRSWLFDIAHNPSAVDTLVQTLRSIDLARPLIAVVGILRDKDWRPMLDRLMLDTDAIILAQPESAPAERRWDLEAARSYLVEGSRVDARVEEDLERALSLASELSGSGVVLVTGSAYTVGDARRIMGVDGLTPDD